MLAMTGDDATIISFPIYTVTLPNSLVRFKSLPLLSKYKQSSSADV